MPEDPLTKFQSLLRELFQLDSQDLDFGIYRVLYLKRAEIEKFITERLPQIVEEAFAEYAAADQKEVQRELEAKRKELEETASKLGQQAFDATGQLILAFRETPLGHQFIELETKARAGRVADDLKASVYNDLYAFFSRYYDDGDIFSKPRRGRVEIPFTGHEDVLLYWANKDQYYIKTGEQFKSYRFKADDFAVEFALRNVAVEQNNNRGEKRYYVLALKSPLSWDAATNRLSIFFEYRPLRETEKQTYGKTETQKPQDKLNDHAEQRVLKSNSAKLPPEVKARLAQSSGEDKPSLLRYHLTRFTRKNTADFFIHKNLRGFLGGELDDFLKSEVLRVGELLAHDRAVAERQLARARVLRSIAEKLVAFLAQIEDFQKKLFEKRKFVVRTEYCATLDRVPEELWDEVLRNKEQIAEWRQIYALGDLLEAVKKKKPDRGFLRAHDKLVIDTRHFDEEFRSQLLDKIDNVDGALEGLLIRSENFQALALLLAKYRERVKCIYIDPPYNTGSDEFIYRDKYRHSCWASMMTDRLVLARELLQTSGTIGVSIDNNELEQLLNLLDQVFGPENRRNIVAVKRASVTGPKVINPGVVNVNEFLVIYSKEKEAWKPNRVFRARDRDPRYNVFIKNRSLPPKQWEFVSLLEAFSEAKGVPARKLKKAIGDHEFGKALDAFAIKHCEAVAQVVPLDEAKRSKEAIELKRKSENSPNEIFVLSRRGFDDLYLIGGKRILFYADRLITIGSETVQGELLTDIWDDTLPNDLHNEGGVQLKKGKKPEKLIGRLIELATNKNDLVLDFFVGSGTASAAAQKLGRRSIGVEIGELYDEKAFPRFKNTLAGDPSGISPATNWQGGGFFSTIVLEQYEDSLNNLELPRAQESELALKQFGDEYLLRYMLEFETAGSASLLSLEQMRHPFAYKLKVQEGDAMVERVVDVVETFNYLLGLDVKKLRQFRDGERLYRATLGEQRNQKSAVVIWRDLEGLEEDATALQRDAEFIEQEILPALFGKENKPDRVLVNGMCVVDGAEPIEPEFHRLMFAPIA